MRQMMGQFDARAAFWSDPDKLHPQGWLQMFSVPG